MFLTLIRCRLRLAGVFAFPGEFFGELKGVRGMFMRLRAEFMRGKMVSLAVGDRRSFVGVGCEVVQF
jgi:predicted membrane protein